MARILVAEQQTALRLMIEAALKSHGFDVVSVDSGAAAVELLQAEQWPCLIVGAPLPLQRGKRVTLLEHLEQNGAATAARTIVMTTRVTNKELLRRAARLNVYAVFSEPCDVADLLRTVSSCAAGEKPARRWFGFPEPLLKKLLPEGVFTS